MRSWRYLLRVAALTAENRHAVFIIMYGLQYSLNIIVFYWMSAGCISQLYPIRTFKWSQCIASKFDNVTVPADAISKENWGKVYDLAI